MDPTREAESGLELVKKLKSAREHVVVNAVYAHYKNQDLYRVHDVAINESDAEPCVIYQALYGEQILFVRPLKSWCETVEIDGSMVNRFEKIDL